jgi:hypothetical protein
MGLKGYRLWGMGKLDSNVQSPTAPPPLPNARTPSKLPQSRTIGRGVAVHKSKSKASKS